MKQLTPAIKTIRALAPVAAGQTEQVTSIIDTANFQTVRFIVSFGAITSGAATSVKLQQNSANSTSGMADLEGTGITVIDTDDNTLVIAEVTNPRERYVRCVISRATQNSVIDLVIAELGLPRVMPVTQDATVSHAEWAGSPVEGTA